MHSHPFPPLISRAAAAALLLACCPVAAQDEPRPPLSGTLARALDTDRDGVLSAAELGRATQALAKLDRNRDGRLTARELAPEPGARTRRPRPRMPARATLQGPPLAHDEVEKKMLAAVAQLDRDRRGDMNVPRDDGRLLRLLVETMRAKNVVEIGTSNGYSAIWIGLALRSTGGHLLTHEIDPARARLARKNFARAGVTDVVTIVEGNAHETVKRLKKPIDLLFLDADKSGYLDYLDKLLPLVRPGGLVVAHNMVRPRPDPRFIAAIKTNPALDTLFLNMQSAGIAVSLKKSKPAR